MTHLGSAPHQKPGARRGPRWRALVVLLTMIGTQFEPARGAEVVTTVLTSAPYPHASRRLGHTYQHRLYAAATHYSSGKTVICIPAGYVRRSTVDFVVHFHGWNTDVANVPSRYRLCDQLDASGVNAILVIPQGPLDAPDSGDGKLELDPGGFTAFMHDVVDFLALRGTIQTRTIGHIALTAHSGGYGGAGGVLERGGLDDKITDVILFDAGYGYFDAFVNWVKAAPGHHFLSVFTDDTSTGNTQMMGMLAGPQPNVYVRLASDMTIAMLQTASPTFILTTDVEHDELMQKHNWYELFLQTTSLDRR